MRETPLRTADTTVDSQSDGMSCVKTAWWPIDRLPPRCPFASVPIEWRRIESQPGNDCERVTLARVDRDPFARTALTVAAKLG